MITQNVPMPMEAAHAQAQDYVTPASVARLVVFLQIRFFLRSFFIINVFRRFFQ